MSSGPSPQDSTLSRILHIQAQGVPDGPKKPRSESSMIHTHLNTSREDVSHKNPKSFTYQTFPFSYTVFPNAEILFFIRQKLVKETKCKFKKTKKKNVISCISLKYENYCFPESKMIKYRLFQSNSLRSQSEGFDASRKSLYFVECCGPYRVLSI